MMGAKAIAFLVLLGGTPAEHVIEMPSFDECQRAAEFVAQAECMTQGDFDSHLLANSYVETDIKPASGDLAEPGAALQNFPSATARRLRNVMNPPAAAPIKRAKGGQQTTGN